MINLYKDQPLINEIAARFDLRTPNRLALESLIAAITDYEGETYPEIVADLATGVGKTFLMSALIDYAAAQGVRHVLVVTPGNVIQAKTLANFDEASVKYVSGAEYRPFIVTPENFRSGAVGTALRDPEVLKVFVFNVQQLVSPGLKASRKTREINETLGDQLYGYLEKASDLLVIADEHHLYHKDATAFSGAIRELDPFALVGLTATPAESDLGKVVFEYTLGEAIADHHVKVPVIVYRRDGTKDERTQLHDACTLLRQKEAAYREYQMVTPNAPKVKPVLFVVASTIDHANEVGQMIAGQGFIGDPKAVLEITSESSDEALAALSAVESPDSPIRAIVSVNKLKEGWDVKNIGVIVALRRLASQSLTEQILGRGLRLPFGVRTGVPMVDQVDLVSHDSYKQLLAQKDVLRQRMVTTPGADEVDEQGAATSAGELPVPDPTVPTNEAQAVDLNMVAKEEDQPTFDLNPITIQPGGADDDIDEAALFFVETEERQREKPPEPQGRVKDAPQIVFPRRESRLTYAAFTLADIPDGDAQAAGARFITEVPTFLAKDALEAERNGDEISITVAPQKNVEAQQELIGIDTIREDLIAAILRQVEATKTERRGAQRLTDAFLRGAGVTNTTETAQWGENRRQQAIQGIRSLISAAYEKRKREMTYELVAVTLPLEPVIVDGSAKNANNAVFVKHQQFVGWQRNVMPVATFDAGTTEWQIAHMIDRDTEIAWWLRIYTHGPAFIPTLDGNYFPDFIALDTDGVYWVIEGKSNKNANDPDVQRKRKTAEHWARAVRDNDEFGEWHYMFATEEHIKSAGSWAGLKVATSPE